MKQRVGERGDQARGRTREGEGEEQIGRGREDWDGIGFPPHKLRTPPKNNNNNNNNNKNNNNNGEGAKKGKRPPTAFFLFMSDFRKEYKVEHPDNKSVSAVAKEGGERWKSMSDEDKKPYFDKAAELKAEYHNGERSDENNFGGNAGEQEVDQSPKKGPSAPRTDEDDQEDEDGAEEEEKNELDDDI